MLIARLTICSRSKTLRVTALVDTGFSAGLMLSAEDAELLGATLIRSTTGAPRMANDKPLPGRATVLAVGFERGALAPIETPVWVLRAPLPHPLVGAFWLAQCDATLTLGTATLTFGRPRANPSRLMPHRFDPAHPERFGWGEVRLTGLAPADPPELAALRRAVAHATAETSPKRRRPSVRL